jgi:hypothetical protein
LVAIAIGIGIESVGNIFPIELAIAIAIPIKVAVFGRLVNGSLS